MRRRRAVAAIPPPSLERAAALAVLSLRNMTTDEFSRGADRPARLALLEALAERGLAVPPAVYERIPL